jgi:RNA polymerase nonessential primary-like sigma factor
MLKAQTTATADPPDAIRLYLREVGDARLLCAEEEMRYARAAQEGNMEAYQHMIVANLRLVVKLAYHYVNRGLPILDLIEEGNLGLMHAVSKFNPELGFRFSTYASWWIRQNIERAILNQSRTIRLPVHKARQIFRCIRAARRLAQHLDHEPSSKEIAAILAIPQVEVEGMLALSEPIQSADLPYDQGMDAPLLNLLPDEHVQDPTREILEDTIHDGIEHCLEMLDERQQKVLERRFGLHGCKRSTLNEVAEELGVTRERVRQIQLGALRRLRKMLEKEGYSCDSVM